MQKYNEAITIRFTPEVMDKIESIASKAETSKGAIIRQAVTKFLKEYK